MNNLERKYIYSSSLCVSPKPVLLHTLLGSCISVCLWDEEAQLGGMNHFMLPYWNGRGLASPKYGNIAIELLINKMIAHRSQRNTMVAKIFGGARMLKEHSDMFDIGNRNIALAFDMLHKEKIKIVAHSTGGTKGRKLFFDTQTGVVLQRLI